MFFSIIPILPCIMPMLPNPTPPPPAHPCTSVGTCLQLGQLAACEETLQKGRHEFDERYVWLRTRERTVRTRTGDQFRTKNKSMPPHQRFSQHVPVTWPTCTLYARARFRARRPDPCCSVAVDRPLYLSLSRGVSSRSFLFSSCFH